MPAAAPQQSDATESAANNTITEDAQEKKQLLAKVVQDFRKISVGPEFSGDDVQLLEEDEVNNDTVGSDVSDSEEENIQENKAVPFTDNDSANVNSVETTVNRDTAIKDIEMVPGGTEPCGDTSRVAEMIHDGDFASTPDKENNETIDGNSCESDESEGNMEIQELLTSGHYKDSEIVTKRKPSKKLNLELDKKAQAKTKKTTRSGTFFVTEGSKNLPTGKLHMQKKKKTAGE